MTGARFRSWTAAAGLAERARATPCRTWLVPAVLGTGVAVAIGALGGGWKNGVTVGASITALVSAGEALLAANRDLARKGVRS